LRKKIENLLHLKKNNFLNNSCMKYLYIFILSIGFGYAQIGINNPTPNLRAELDIASTTRGVLTPRMTRAQMLLIASPAESLLVYQTDTVGTNITGFYYYQSGNWIALNNNTAWSPSGNSATNPSINYVGTPDAQPYIFKTAAVEQMRILADGKVGIGTATPSVDLEINSTTASALRIDDGFQAAGNILSTTSDGTTIWKTALDVGLIGWNLTGNAATKPPGNSLGTIDTADLSVRAGGVEAMVIQGTGGIGNEGNVRINSTTATLSQLLVESNQISPTPFNPTTAIPVIKAINNNSTANTFSWGIIGQTISTLIGSYAVRGENTNFNGTSGIGVYGFTTRSESDVNSQLPLGSGFTTGVLGRAWRTGEPIPNGNLITDYPIPGQTFAGIYGVYGYVDFGTGKGVYGYNSNLTIGSAYGMYCAGNFAVSTGRQIDNGGPEQIPVTPIVVYPTVKSASVPTTKGNQLVYCKESPEMWFEDFGFGQLQNGTAHIALEDLFLETVFIDASHKMHVVLQEQAESKGLYFIADADHKGFTVKEKKGGNSNSAFSYSIMAKRRFYQEQRFGVDYHQPLGNNLINMKDAEIATTDPMVMKAFVEKVTAEKNALGTSSKEKKQETKPKETSKTSN
jgi:hypothetical protein